MMEAIRDYKGGLACMGERETGLIDYQYKGCKIKTTLAVGSSISLERGKICTIITRDSASSFDVDSFAA